MSVVVEHDVQQGSDAWHALRLGRVTASTVGLLMTPTGAVARNAGSRAHVYELAAQRITGHVDPGYVSPDMMRGHDDEITARDLYARHYAPVRECGYLTRDIGGAQLGYSPDGLVGDDGLIELKSRAPKHQLATSVGGIPTEYLLQVQTGLLVSGRSWCDYVSYSGGMPLVVLRATPDHALHERIIATCRATEDAIAKIIDKFNAAVLTHGWYATERRVFPEIF